MWKTLSEEEKEIYENKRKELERVYRKSMTTWKRKTNISVLKKHVDDISEFKKEMVNKKEFQEIQNEILEYIKKNETKKK